MRYRVLYLALSFVLSLSLMPLGAQATSLTPISSLSEPLWQALLPIASSLPNSYDLFMTSLTSQVDALTLNNGQLQTSNDSLTRENAVLRESLKASQEAEATSESKYTLLQKDLSDSTASTIQAQRAAKSLELQLGVWKIAGGVAITVALAAAVYEGGKIVGAWK